MLSTRSESDSKFTRRKLASNKFRLLINHSCQGAVFHFTILGRFHAIRNQWLKNLKWWRDGVLTESCVLTLFGSCRTGETRERLSKRYSIHGLAGSLCRVVFVLAALVYYVVSHYHSNLVGDGSILPWKTSTMSLSLVQVQYQKNEYSTIHADHRTLLPCD